MFLRAAFHVVLRVWAARVVDSTRGEKDAAIAVLKGEGVGLEDAKCRGEGEGAFVYIVQAKVSFSFLVAWAGQFFCEKALGRISRLIVREHDDQSLSKYACRLRNVRGRNQTLAFARNRLDAI